MNTFTIYDDHLAIVETFTGRLVFQDARDIAELQGIFANYQSHAVFDDDARALLQEWARSCRP